MFYIGFYLSKFIKLILKIFNKKASYLPGKVAGTLCNDFLNKIDKPKIIIGVTGTNGKTTVCNLLNSFFEKNNYKVLNNKYGSNVKSGIITTFINGVGLTNKTNYDIAILEIDERSIPKILPFIKLDYLICTNLFRDSIKRNANADFIFDIINNNISDNTKLILNADDLISSSLGDKNEKVFFSVDKLDTDLKESINIINDMRICPKCHTRLKYKYLKYHHIGNAFCPNCKFKSPKSDYKVSNVDFNNKKITIIHDNNTCEYNLVNDSIFNIYNIVCVVAFLSEFKIENKKIIDFLKKERIVESRYKKDKVNNINIITHMAKGQNAVACSCVFDYVRKEPNKKEIILLLYDLFDSKNSSENISWLYDCDFEFLNDDNIDKIIIGGPRCNDFYLRLLLAGIPKEKLFSVKKENDTINYLSLEKKKDIYILYELYDEKIANNIRVNLIKKIIKGNKK